MAGNDMGKDGTEVVRDTKVTKDPTQLLADARKAGQDAVDAVLDLIPEVEHKLPPVYPRIDVASVLTISRHYTEEALKNVHTQISDLIRTHVVGPEQAGVFFNTILPITCSFRHQMDEMAINLLYCPFCSYTSTNHRTLNNHIRMHLRLSLACGMPDCWFITHSAESMWKHAATHKLHTSEPIAVYKKK